MSSYTVDTYRAVKTLTEAGAAEALAEAIVNTFGSIPFEDLATKVDLRGLAAKADLKDFATKADLKDFATKADLKDFATKADLKDFATKADLKDFVTKAYFDAVVANLVTKDEFNAALENLRKDFATKAELEAGLERLRKEIKSDLKILEHRMTLRLGAMIFAAAGILGTLQSIL